MAPDYKNAALMNDTSHQCAVYDVVQDRMEGSSCNRRLPMICRRNPLKSAEVQPILADDQSFCPPGWVTHPLVLDSGMCFRRFRTPQQLDWDEAEAMCGRYGGHLAAAGTQPLLAVLDQVLLHFSNQSGHFDSWIGLRQISVRCSIFIHHKSN